MIPIGGLLLVIIAEPPNRIELLNRRLLHTSRDGEEHLACDQHRLVAEYRTRGRYATGSDTRATREKPENRRGVQVKGCRPDSASI